MANKVIVANELRRVVELSPNASVEDLADMLGVSVGLWAYAWKGTPVTRRSAALIYEWLNKNAKTIWDQWPSLEQRAAFTTYESMEKLEDSEFESFVQYQIWLLSDLAGRSRLDHDSACRFWILAWCHQDLAMRLGRDVSANLAKAMKSYERVISILDALDHNCLKDRALFSFAGARYSREPAGNATKNQLLRLWLEAKDVLGVANRLLVNERYNWRIAYTAMVYAATLEKFPECVELHDKLIAADPNFMYFDYTPNYRSVKTLLENRDLVNFRDYLKMNDPQRIKTTPQKV